MATSPERWRTRPSQKTRFRGAVSGTALKVPADPSPPLGTWPGWPTVYAIDARGVIRFRDLYENGMDEPLEQLIREAELLEKPQ